MDHGQTLTRGGRIFGAVACALLALLGLGWIVRDLLVADTASELWWKWAGAPAAAANGVWATSVYEPVLVVVYAAVTFSVLRSSAAAGMLGTAGVLTVLLRAPSLWNLNADWLRGVDEELRDRALFTVVCAVVLGVAMLLVAVLARREVTANTSYGYPPVRTEEAPAPAGTLACIAAFLLLAASGGVGAAWQIHRAGQAGWDGYLRELTGERSLLSLLAPPPAGVVWIVVALTLFAAAAALAQAALARPLGMTMAWTLLVWGGTSVSYAWKADFFERFQDLPTRTQLELLTALLYAGTGLLVLLLLGRRPPRPEEEPLAGWQPPGTAYGRSAEQTGSWAGPGGSAVPGQSGGPGSPPWR